MKTFDIHHTVNNKIMSFHILAISHEDAFRKATAMNLHDMKVDGEVVCVVPCDKDGLNIRWSEEYNPRKTQLN